LMMAVSRVKGGTGGLVSGGMERLLATRQKSLPKVKTSLR
jgi:hypothetical protein